MTAPRFRCVAFFLSAASLLNGLALSVAHHHCNEHATEVATLSDCLEHEDVCDETGGTSHSRHHHRPSERSHASDDCQICHYLAQSRVTLDLGGAVIAPLPRGSVEILASDTPVAIHTAVFDVRGPPA